MPRKSIIIMICISCLIVKGNAQNYSVIQVKGECQMKDNNSWKDVTQGNLLHDDTHLKNKYLERGSVSIALKDRLDHNMYMVNFIESFHMQNLKVTDAPSRFSASVSLVKHTAEREISSLTTEVINPFRNGDVNFETDSPELHIARAIKSKLLFEDNNQLSISQTKNSPMLALILSKHDNIEVLSASNLTEKKRYIFLIHINPEYKEIRTSGRLYEIEAMSECTLVSETDELTMNEITIAVSTDRPVIPDNVNLILSHMLDTDKKEHTPYEDLVGISTLLVLK